MSNPETVACHPPKRKSAVTCQLGVVHEKPVGTQHRNCQAVVSAQYPSSHFFELHSSISNVAAGIALRGERGIKRISNELDVATT
ncbi:hypothetical protein CA54_00330 [Symmachiella macrocystis]|uniref:Uncharacterized protein n=1 Tax=Symmachiella macrocystis TaxID=2527985 RepID=A0A5C6BJ80_9PLAN|nr:hypothetical protein CA54_00330 [Symmachiella macrocystis]